MRDRAERHRTSVAHAMRSYNRCFESTETRTSILAKARALPQPQRRRAHILAGRGRRGCCASEFPAYFGGFSRT